MSPPALPRRAWIRSSFLPTTLVTAAVAIGALGCSNSEATYSFDIKGPRQVFNDAKTVSLYQNNKMVATSGVNAGGSFSLEVGGLDPLAGSDPVIFSIRAFDAANALVAYGEAPGVEILPQDNQLSIFVQKPGTLVQVEDLPLKLKDHVAFESETVSASTSDYHVTAPVFGFGVTASGAASTGLYIYNPLLHRTDKLTDLSPARSDLAAPESPALAHGDNPLLLFGGIALPDRTLADRLDELVILRQGLATFSVGVSLKVMLPPEFLRAGGVIATAYSGTRRMVFGGRDQSGAPLASVAVIDEITGVPTNVLNHPPMIAARDGHTVTIDPSTADGAPWGRALVYGGVAAGGPGPIAEVLEVKGQTFAPLPTSAPAGATLQAHPGTGRHGHRALILPSKSAKGSLQVLIVGGYDDANVVRGDALLCVPAEMVCSDPGLRLSQPRARFAAFVVRDDLVVIGGIDAAGAPIASAEIFNASTLAPKGKIDAVARIAPTATTLGNGSTIVIGGEAADGTPQATVEIYQPYRTAE
jgi:hypothetical protein